MAKRVPNEFNELSNEFFEQTWKPNYKIEGEFSHPSRRALNILFDNASQTIRLFSQFDPEGFDLICYSALRQTSLTASIIRKLLGDEASEELNKRYLPFWQAAYRWMKSFEQKQLGSANVRAPG